MALPDTLIVRLIETVKSNNLSGNFLMLGRQRWGGARRGASADLFRETMELHLPGETEDSLRNGDNEYSERFFQRLGFDTVDSMDISDFENASIIQDLGGELDPALQERFDVIYDGGTCEHIFDLPTAYRNIHAMLRPGGVLIGHSPCNNWINHSFYQINPEMVYGYWETAMGYEVLEVSLQPIRPRHARQVATTTNPNETGKRPRIQGDLPPNSPVILNYAVRKPAVSTAPQARVYQSDYTVRWQEGSEAERQS